MEDLTRNRSEPLPKTFDLFGDQAIDRESSQIASPGAEFYMRQLTGPVTVAWNVTESCNLRCLHCFNNSGPLKNDELTHGEAMRLVDDIIDMQVFNVCICGGEPLLRKDLLEIIRLLSHNGIMVSMVSNGYLIDRDVAAALAQAGVRFLQISIDGATAQTHERLRQKKGAFKRAVNAARYVSETGIELAVAFCPTRFNVNEFPDYVDMCYGLGAKMIRMMPLLRLGRTIRNKDRLIPDGEQMVQFIWWVREKGLAYLERGLSLEWGDPLEHLYLFPYNEAKLFILEIHANGDLGISAYLPLYFGNVRQGSLRDYWEAGLKDAWRHPVTLEHARKIEDLEDLQRSETLPWENRGVYVDLIANMERTNVRTMKAFNPRLADTFRIRDELSGIRSIFPLKNGSIRQVHFLNQTAIQVFELCNGQNSTEDIVKVLHSRFPDIESKVMLEDVKECLYSMRNLGLIHWEDTETDRKNGFSARVAEEKDLKAISGYILSRVNGNVDTAAGVAYIPVAHKSYYTPVAIRLRQFHNKEVFFLLEKDGEVAGAASLAAMGPPLKSSQISLFIVDGDRCEEDAVCLLDCLLTMIGKLGLLKLKCGIIPDTNNPNFLAFLLKNQFDLEATLANEMGYGQDVLIYSKLL
jgi:MoaA/NifB/PqqE/SkfB family radical SAM enzyme